MPVPASINDLSTTAGSNYPQGTDTPTTGDDTLRALASFIATLRDQLNGTSATGTIKTPVFSGNPTGTVTGSTYTPTTAAVANCSTPGASFAQYSRVGTTVTVAGTITAIVTGAGSTQVRATFPIASNITGSTDVNGVGVEFQNGRVAAIVNGDTTNKAAVFQWFATGGGAATVYYQYSYEVK